MGRRGDEVFLPVIRVHCEVGHILQEHGLHILNSRQDQEVDRTKKVNRNNWVVLSGEISCSEKSVTVLNVDACWGGLKFGVGKGEELVVMKYDEEKCEKKFKKRSVKMEECATLVEEKEKWVGLLRCVDCSNTVFVGVGWVLVVGWLLLV